MPRQKKSTSQTQAATRPVDPLSIWDKAEPSQRAAPTALTRELIVQAAISLADHSGLDGLSLRNVGAVLSAGPMRLYPYIGSKSDLLDLMADAIYGEVLGEGPLPPEWQGAMRVHAERLRRAAHRHGWFGGMLGGRPHQGPHALFCLEQTLAALDRSGQFGDINDTLAALRTLEAWIAGAIQGEAREREAEQETGLNKAAWQVATGRHLQTLINTGRFPTLARVVEHASHPDPDRVFEDGLQCVLAGIAARLGRSAT